MWDDYNQLGAKRLDGYQFSHIQRAIVKNLLIIPEGIERKFFCAKAIFECIKFIKRGMFLGKLWCCVCGEYYKIIWFYQLGW